MTVQPRHPVKGSLVERVADMFDLGNTLMGRPLDVEPEARHEPAFVAAPAVAEAQPLAPKTAHKPRARNTNPVAQIDRKALEQVGMLIPGGPVTPLAEEFRLVKRQLLLTAREVKKSDAIDRSRVVMVCSAQPNEGKTFCAINLALSMSAEKDMEILLIDGDFAKPDVFRRLGVPETSGLLDALADPSRDVESLVIPTDVPNLSLLPAGARSDSDVELLTSDRTAVLLGKLLAANPKRLVIFDSPPALAASPASVLASHVGQIMLVVRADKTAESDIREAVNMLDGCEHISLVLNSVALSPGGRRFGDYYGYGYGQASEKTA